MLSSWQDGKVHLLFFGTQGLPTLRLLVPIYQLRDRIAAAYVDTTSQHNSKLVDR